MTSLGLALVFTATTSGALHTTVEAGDRTEVRLRQDAQGTPVVFDAETLPSLRLFGTARRESIRAEYAPRFTLRGVGSNGSSREQFQQGNVEATLRDRHTFLGLASSAAYGTQNFSYLTPVLDVPSAPTRPADRLPAPTSITYSSFRAAFTARVQFAPRLFYLADFEYLASGGADAASRAVVPYQYGPRGEQGLEWAATRKDRVGGALTAWRTLSSNEREATSFEETLVFRHRFTATTESRFAAGVSEVIVRVDPASPRATKLHPIAEATIAQTLPEGRFDLRLDARLGPFVDRLTGLVDERASLTGSLRWLFTSRIGVRAALSGTQSVPASEAGALRVFSGEGALLLRAARRVAIEAGTRSAWQSQQGVDGHALQWVVFVAVSATTTPLAL